MHDSETSAADPLSKEGQRYDPFAAPKGFRSGFVAILGEPNVGKSTMLNDMLDFKIAITSPKAQTTRDRISGIYTDEKCQIVFVDTPGIMDPHDPFNTCLRDTALEVLEEADVALHLVDATAPRALPEEAADALYSANIARVLVINKTDRLPDSKSAFALSGPDEKRAYAVDKLHLPFSPEAYDAVCYVSALKGNGLPEMIETARRYLPEGPYLYDPDQLTDRDMRFLASELVREKVLQFLEQEVPYSIATRTDDFVENPGGKHLVRVIIYVEQESQKSIVIGKGGSMLRKIGSAARPEIEAMCDHPVFLELWVKVRKKWRKREESLREFGYRPHAAKKRKKKR